VRWILALAACVVATAAAAQDLQAWEGPTPALALPDLQGRVHRLADYRGRVVLVNFWATWCAPCREEMPSIQRLRRSLEGQPFEVLAVNLGEPASRVRGFLEQAPLGLPVLLDGDTEAARAWKARVLPATYLVDADGRVRYWRFGAADWAEDPARARVLELIGRIPRKAFESAERSADGANRLRLAASAR